MMTAAYGVAYLNALASEFDGRLYLAKPTKRAGTDSAHPPARRHKTVAVRTIGAPSSGMNECSTLKARLSSTIWTRDENNACPCCTFIKNRFSLFITAKKSN